MAELDLRALRYFVAVAEELHFGKAAERVYVSQPAISVQVRKLEQGLGVRLFDRSSRHVELTPAGRALLEEARPLLARAERAADAAQSASGDHRRGRLVIGFLGNAAAELTWRIISRFRARHPSVLVEMRRSDFSDPYSGLADADVDVAFVRLPLRGHGWLRLHTLFHEPRVLCVSSRNRLASSASLSMEMLVEEPFVAREAPGYWRDFWLATGSRAGIEPRIGAEVSDVEECFAAILAGRGVALTQASTQRFFGRPGLAFVPVEDLPPSTVSIAWRADSLPRHAADFVATARSLGIGDPGLRGRTPGSLQVSSVAGPPAVSAAGARRDRHGDGTTAADR